MNATFEFRTKQSLKRSSRVNRSCTWWAEPRPRDFVLEVWKGKPLFLTSMETPGTRLSRANGRTLKTKHHMCPTVSEISSKESTWTNLLMTSFPPCWTIFGGQIGVRRTHRKILQENSTSLHYPIGTALCRTQLNPSIWLGVDKEG